eukprot:8397058-Lingulodinium_polyedra.AAC.1
MRRVLAYTWPHGLQEAVAERSVGKTRLHEVGPVLGQVAFGEFAKPRPALRGQLNQPTLVALGPCLGEGPHAPGPARPRKAAGVAAHRFRRLRPQ